MANVRIEVPEATLSFSAGTSLPTFKVLVVKVLKSIISNIQVFTATDVLSLFAFTGRQKEHGGSVYLSIARGFTAPFSFVLGVENASTNL